MDLKGKTILIVGPGRVGHAVAHDLAAAGANLLITFNRSQGTVVRLVDEVKGKYGVRAYEAFLDVMSESAIRRMLDLAHVEIDGVVLMASVYSREPSRTHLPDIIHCFHANAFGHMTIARILAEALKREGKADFPIVTFGDWAIDHPYAGYGLYLAAKSALCTYMRALQVEFAGTIRVVNIHPGMLAPPADLPEKEKQEIIANTPVKQAGDPQQAARLVRTALECDFLATDIYLDGGQHWRHRL